MIIVYQQKGLLYFKLVQYILILQTNTNDNSNFLFTVLRLRLYIRSTKLFFDYSPSDFSNIIFFSPLKFK